jgi:hypothetical protein
MSYNPSNPNGQATSANSAPVVLASDQSAVPISDNGSSLTVDGSVTVSGTVTANAGTGTMNVSVQNASIPVTDNGSSLTVDGSVSVSNFPATQPVSGTVTIQDGGNTITVDGTVDTELPAAVALSDALSNPTTPIVGAANLGFNGTTWDRLKTDASLAGNGANDTSVGILAAGIGPGFSIRMNPANLGTAANSASTMNVDGANSITVAIATTTTGTFIIEGTADNTNWVTLEVFEGSQDIWVSGQNITPTAGRVYQLLTQGYRQVRLRTVTTLGATVSHFVTLSSAQQFLGGIDTGPAPHNFGYTIIHRDGEYATQQTGVALWTPAAGRRFAVSSLTITTGGTTAGIVTVWQGASGDTTYSAGTDPAIFRGEFAPSANSKPGVVKSFTVPFVSTTADHVLRVTTSAAMTVYVQVDGYEI